MFKKFKKVATRVVSVALALVLTATVAFAGESKTTKAGSSDSVTVASVSKVHGVNGTISVSDPSGILESYSFSAGSGLSGKGEISGGSVFFSHSDAFSGNIKASYKVAKGATVGATATITFTGETADENGDMHSFSDSAVITVGKASSGSSSSDSSSSGSTGVTAPTTVTPATKADLTELERLIAIANQLNKADYTADSWANLIAALHKAKSMTVYNAQADVDAAAAALQAAIDGLVKIDYTELLAAIQSAKDLMDSTEFSKLWNELLSALDNANANLEGTSQAEVDSAAAALREIVAKLEEILNAMNTPAEPAEGVCTVPFHKLLIMLLVVSCGLNVILGFVLYNNSKKRKQDNVPMVKH